MATFFEATTQKNKLSKLVSSHSDVHGIGVGYANPKTVPRSWHHRLCGEKYFFKVTCHFEG
ncbi:hypothetical protein CLV36_102252 [Laceyella sediminis]|uniref:Uncharacterized protein n=1 Tax=Laceyella sediminis TaxID=573074 RepID=A0ABX5ESS1_9BACL|nr:hypothetical protein CLV36_102252 [Laceyella sediminis]